jgi:hypothetical protein
MRQSYADNQAKRVAEASVASHHRGQGQAGGEEDE